MSIHYEDFLQLLIILHENEDPTKLMQYNYPGNYTIEIVNENNYKTANIIFDSEYDELLFKLKYSK